MTLVDVFTSEYEAFYRVMYVGANGSTSWTTWCVSKECRDNVTCWTYTGMHYDVTREAGLAHCREKHVRLAGW